MEALNQSYQEGVTDEFVEPMVKEGYGGVVENSSMIFLNFRKDRAIQLSQEIVKNLSQRSVYFLTMTRY